MTRLRASQQRMKCGNAFLGTAYILCGIPSANRHDGQRRKESNRIRAKGFIPTSVIQANLPPLFGALVFGKPFVLYHRFVDSISPRPVCQTPSVGKTCLGPVVPTSTVSLLGECSPKIDHRNQRCPYSNLCTGGPSHSPANVSLFFSRQV